MDGYGNWGWSGSNWNGPYYGGSYGYYGGPAYYNTGWAPYYTDYWNWDNLDFYDYNNNGVLDDNEMADEVTDNIQADWAIPQSDRNNIQVRVNDGIVTLTGTVKKPRSKPLAYSDAFWSQGVIDVDNQLQVKQPQNQDQRQNGQSQQPQTNQRQNRQTARRGR